MLYNFTGEPDGANPYARPLRDTSGNLYGTNAAGAYGSGSVFKLDTAGAERVLHSFTGPVDWANPYSAGLIEDAKGDLCGTTYGGCPGYGVVFKLDPTGKELCSTASASPVVRTGKSPRRFDPGRGWQPMRRHD